MKKIIILGTDGDSTRAMYHRVNRSHTIHQVILEQPVSRMKLIKGRIRRLGVTEVMGQLMFMTMVQKWLSLKSAPRIKEIAADNGLVFDPIPDNKVVNIESINDDEARDLIKESKPDLILVSGTRIISKKTLASVDCPWINIHAGITPKYRGVHGGYWALRNGERNLCGVTVHYVDSGIDTGSVIAQGLIEPTSEDSFSTYPYLQLAGTGLLSLALPKILNGESVQTAPLTKESRLWHHPTISTYLSGSTK